MAYGYTAGVSNRLGKGLAEPLEYQAGIDLLEWSYAVSEHYLAKSLPRRWAHTQGVARQARLLKTIVGQDARILEAAAVLHDVGYSPSLAQTGFHPLDGADYLISVGAPTRLADLVAHHSCAVIEAGLRNLTAEFSKYSDERGVTRDALWYCDQTTTPDGEVTNVFDRMAEVKHRYGEGHISTQFTDLAEPQLVAAVSRIEALQCPS